MPDLSAYLNQTVRFRPKTGTDGFGRPLYGPVEEVPARYTESQQLVRNGSGQEVMSSAQALMEREAKLGDQIEGRSVMSRENIVVKDGEVIGWRAFL